jgi:hypothetical protein
MMKNISDRERVIRIILGGAIMLWGGAARSWWGLLGLIPLITGLVGFCGFYKIMGSCCPFSSKGKQGGGCCSK